MTVMRGRVTAVDTRGVFVRVAALGPDVLGPLEWLGSKPEVDDGVLVLNAGTESAPDLVVMRGGDTRYLPLTGGTIAGSLYIGNNGLRLWIDGSFAALSAAGYNVSVRAGLTELNIGYSAAAGSGYVSTNRQTQAAHPANALATKGYVDQIKTDIKAIAAASSSFADFQTRIAAW